MSEQTRGPAATLRAAALWALPEGATELIRALAAAKGTAEHTALAGWEQGSAASGWDDAAMAERLVERWPAFLAACAGTAPLDAAHEASSPIPRNIAFHNTYMTFGYVLARAAYGRKRLSVLDWGGGLGHYFVLARALMPDLVLDYHVKDLPEFCERGRALLPEVTFHDDDTYKERSFDLVVASGALQYSQDWQDAASDLARVAGRHLYITRLPVFLGHPSAVVRQDARAHGFDSSFVGWFLNRPEFLAHLATCGVTLAREFYLAEYPEVSNIAEKPDVRGFLFEKPAAGSERP